jgi:pentatricopeptide repeat protein
MPMKRRLVLLASLLLGACASLPPPPQPDALFDDAAFAPPGEAVDTQQVFALSEPMRRYLDVEIAAQLYRKGARDGLVDALYTRGQLKLEYDSALTRNAAQAFEARSGNCLSLVIMTAALARHLGLAVQFNDVFTDETWSRSGDLMVNSGHVNLTLGHRLGDDRFRFDGGSSLMIDFDPPKLGERPMVRAIGESTVTAMFMNNRSAEALVAGRIADAYWWARGALRQAPTFAAAYNTLAVVYLRHGQPQRAEQVLRYMLEREPANTTLLANLVRALEAQGRAGEAQQAAQRLASIEPTPPFHWFNVGIAALKRQDYRSARDAFSREVDRAAYYHEFHYGLALAYFGLGEITQGRRHLAIAMENSTTSRDRELYAGKLEKLRALRVQ